eukprot:2468855-Rhodomonas_salina.1
MSMTKVPASSEGFHHSCSPLVCVWTRREQQLQPQAWTQCEDSDRGGIRTDSDSETVEGITNMSSLHATNDIGGVRSLTASTADNVSASSFSPWPALGEVRGIGQFVLSRGCTN